MDCLPLHGALRRSLLVGGSMLLVPMGPWSGHLTALLRRRQTANNRPPKPLERAFASQGGRSR
eukprot:13013263-Alexandrium_andersonii.AAC.1